MLVTLTLKIFSTFSVMSFGTLLIPVLWIICCVDLLDVSIRYERRLMEFLANLSAYFSIYVNRRSDCLRYAMDLVVVVHTSCLPKFLHQNVIRHQWGPKSTSGQSWWSSCKNIAWLLSSLLPKTTRSHPFLHQQEHKYQKICSETQLERFFHNIWRNILCETRQQGQRVMNRFHC